MNIVGIIVGELILNNNLMNYFNEFGSKINIPKCLSTFINNLIARGELGILVRGFNGIINNNSNGDIIDIPHELLLSNVCYIYPQFFFIIIIK